MYIKFYIDEKFLKIVDNYWEKRGFASRAAFVRECIRKQIYPTNNDTDRIFDMVQEMKQQEKKIEQEIKQLTQEKDKIMEKNTSSPDEKLDERILEYLGTMGESTIFSISQDLNEESSKIYNAITNLIKMKQITQDEKMRFKLDE